MAKRLRMSRLEDETGRKDIGSLGESMDVTMRIRVHVNVSLTLSVHTRAAVESSGKAKFWTEMVQVV